MSDILFPSTKDAVWEKGVIVPGLDSIFVRKDKLGNWMSDDEYQITQSDDGWEVDHILPKAL